MQLYVADYLGDTRHLTTEQHGAYLLLLMTMWRTGGSLPSDPKKLARMTACTPSRWTRISPDVLAFFEDDGEALTHKRLMLEFKNATEKRNQLAVVGSLGGKAKALKTKEPDLANASPMLAYTRASSTPTLEPEREEDPKPLSGVVAPKPEKPKSRASKRCPEDWAPKWSTIDKLESEGFTPGDLERAMTRMRDHEYKIAKTDWDAAFRNWVRTDHDRRPKPNDAKLTAKQANMDRAFGGYERAARRVSEF